MQKGACDVNIGVKHDQSGFIKNKKMLQANTQLRDEGDMYVLTIYIWAITTIWPVLYIGNQRWLN